MASADLREELTCSVCLSLYTDPVTLTCGHNFCRSCIDRVLDTQERTGVYYTCPDCREEFRERPAMRRNTTLCNIAERLRSTQPEEEEPKGDLGNRACTIHQKILNYYCCVDSTCICTSCLSAGHSGHQLELLDDASKKKKKRLINVLEKLVSRRDETEKRLQSLQKFSGEVQDKAGWVTETAADLFRDIRRQLEDLESRVSSEVSTTKERILSPVLDLIQQLELKDDALSRKMCRIDELCNISDPVTVLQDTESDKDDFCDSENGEHNDNKLPHMGELEEGLILEKICSGLSDIVSAIMRRYKHASTHKPLDLYAAPETLSDTAEVVHLHEHADILLDVNTASNSVHVSSDLKTASWSKTDQNRPETPERFQYAQIESTKGFVTGRHYWEVETSELGFWRVGMCYPSIEKKGALSIIGDNNKSWCVRWHNKTYSIIQDNTEVTLCHRTCPRLRIYLDYEAGTLSFYELCDPIRHLHTFTATFVEPLHAAFRLYKAWVRIAEDNQL